MSSSSPAENRFADARGQRRIARLVRDGKKATVTQITSHYNQSM